MITDKTVIMVLDTETCNDLETPFVYDVGYHIITLADGVLCERSFVNADMFCDNELMATAYFADKIPAYWEQISNGQRTLKKWANIKRQIALDCKEFNVEIVCAHNALFDNRALNTTQRYETTSRFRYFLPYGLEWWDTLRMSREVLKQNESFGEFCYENDYLTKRGQRRYTAEIIYRWLSGNNDFEESHTGLEDVKIETEILKYCLAVKPDIDGRLWRD